MNEGIELVRQRFAEAPSAARLDLYKACAVLSMSNRPSAHDYADAVARTLEQALGRAPDLSLVGDDTLSFDESWLRRLIERSEACDSASVAFLISSRIPRGKRASVAFLINGLTESLTAA